MTDVPGRAADAPPGTEGARGRAAIGLAGVVLGVLLAVCNGFDSLVTLLGVLAVFAGLHTGGTGAEQLQARRVGRRSGRCWWSSLCSRSDTLEASYAFVVDSDAVRLYTLRGQRVAEWPWSTVIDAVAMPIIIGGREQPGMMLETRGNAPSPSFGFPATSGFGVSAEMAQRVAEAVRDRLALR